LNSLNRVHHSLLKRLALPGENPLNLPVVNDSSIVFFYHRLNRHGLNALAGAAEAEPSLAGIRMAFPATEPALLTELERIASAGRRALVAFSFMTQQFEEFSRLARGVRKKHAHGVLLVAGGPHPTGDPEGTLKAGFHAVAIGEGEETFVQIAQKFMRDESLDAIKGIACLQKDGGVKFNARRPGIVLDKYPPFPVAHGKFSPVEITRGCPFACAFCQASQINGQVQRHRSIESICKYADAMASTGRGDLRVITPNAFAYGSRDGRVPDLGAVEKLLREARRALGSGGCVFFGSFPSEVRPEHVTKEAVRLVTGLADNDNLVIGAQSGSQRLLDLCGRGHTVEHGRRATEICLEAGLKAYVDIIFGLPGETREDFLLTIDFMNELVARGARIHAHVFMPLPGTRFAHERAGRVRHEFSRQIGRMCRSGAIFGDWGVQQKTGMKGLRHAPGA
jgi:B12-binding domain/radical SAM domain protein